MIAAVQCSGWIVTRQEVRDEPNNDPRAEFFYPFLSMMVSWGK